MNHMIGRMIGCGCYILLGCCFIFFGVWLIVVKRDKPIRFWANVEELPKVNDINGYNRAVGKLWCVYGLIIALLGLPLLGRALGVILTILGTCWVSIGLMIIYSVVILKKYEIK